MTDCIHVQAVTRNELYGYVHPATREWREGLISTTFRDMSNNKHNKHQWILLDGDIDAEWIEVSFTPMQLAVCTGFVAPDHKSCASEVCALLRLCRKLLQVRLYILTVKAYVHAPEVCGSKIYRSPDYEG